MATVAPPADKATDLMQKLPLDSQAKSLELHGPTNKASVTQYGAADSTDAVNGLTQPYERSMTPILQDFMEPSVCYLPNVYPSTGYYYGGYDGMANEWDDHLRYGNPDGAEGVYGDNGSLMYHGYGYGPYAPYQPAGSPVPAVVHDGQLYGPHHYQYLSPYFQAPNPTSGSYSPSPPVPSKSEVSPSARTEQAQFRGETANGNSNGGILKGKRSSAIKTANHPTPFYNTNISYARGALPGGILGFQDPRYAFDGLHSPVPWLDGPLFPDMQPQPFMSTPNLNSAAPGNRNLHSHTHFMGSPPVGSMPGTAAANGCINQIYPNDMYRQCGNAFRYGHAFGLNGCDSQIGGRAWPGVDNKYKLRGRNNDFFGSGNDDMDGLNELSRGPRAKSTKNPKGAAPVASVAKGQDGSTNDEEKYNRADFPIKYDDAKFFIIKSYSEDDVHKSVKYNVWASTPNGNKKLDAAYQEAAQQRTSGCPVFLFFSVNTSGQFVGVAEMVGPVDFERNLEYWQQDKWNGCFPVKWHIVKDVPNSLLKHIILENNESKPVTNSRDTQEVMLEQGLEMLKIFKEYSSVTCILDDFEFYVVRQKTIKEKKAKQQQYTKQRMQAWEDNKVKETANSESKSSKTGEGGEAVEVAEKMGSLVIGDGEAVPKMVPNGVANGC